MIYYGENMSFLEEKYWAWGENITTDEYIEFIFDTPFAVKNYKILLATCYYLHIQEEKENYLSESALYDLVKKYLIKNNININELNRVKKFINKIKNRNMVAMMDIDVLIIDDKDNYAVGLKYNKDTEDAPRVIVTGVQDFSIALKNIAKNNNTPIIKYSILAKDLSENTMRGREISEKFYETIAEIYTNNTKGKENATTKHI